MSIFKRIFGIGKAEVNDAIDKIEDPVKMTKQGIRELREDLDKSIQSLAEVKAIAIRTKGEMEKHKQQAIDYEQKAMALLQRAQTGAVPLTDAERLATEALTRKEEMIRLAQDASTNFNKYDTMANNLEAKTRELKSNIAKCENELKTLEARSKVSEATANINKQLANIDSSSTVSMLERMKEKVAQTEALAESYAQIGSIEKSVDDEINKALASGASMEVDAKLIELKQKMGLLAPSTDDTPLLDKPSE